MKTFKALQAIVATLVLFAAGTTSTAQARNWTIHNYSADGFSVSLPSDPQVNAQTDPAGSSMRSYSIDLGQGMLMIGVMRFGSMMPTNDSDAILQNGKNGALAQSKTHLVSEKKITIDGSPGLEFEAENETLHFRARIYIAGNTAYQLVEGYPIGKPFDHAADFFDSFRLTAAAPASKPADGPDPK